MKHNRFNLLRAWLALPLVLSLTACVTYYYPAVDTSDGVYIAAEDPAYRGNATDYTYVRYYPWWSVDYFYLGYGYYGAGFSLGLSYGHQVHHWAHGPYPYPAWYYDPWYYTYWYAPIHHHPAGFHFGHHDPYWHARYRGYYPDHRHDRGHRGGGRHDADIYAGAGGHSGDHDHPRGVSMRYREDGRRVPDGGIDPGTGASTRRVTVAPSAAPGDRGMVVSHRDGTKWSRSRTEPVEGSVVPGSAFRTVATQPAPGARMERPAAGEPGPAAPVKRPMPRIGPVSVDGRVGGSPAPAWDSNRSTPVPVARPSEGRVVVREPHRGKPPVQRLESPRPAPASAATPSRSAPPLRESRPRPPSAAQRGQRTVSAPAREPAAQPQKRSAARNRR